MHIFKNLKLETVTIPLLHVVQHTHHLVSSDFLYHERKDSANRDMSTCPHLQDNSLYDKSHQHFSFVTSFIVVQRAVVSLHVEFQYP